MAKGDVTTCNKRMLVTSPFCMLTLLSAPVPGVENKRNNWLKTYRDGGF